MYKGRRATGHQRELGRVHAFDVGCHGDYGPFRFGGDPFLEVIRQVHMKYLSIAAADKRVAFRGVPHNDFDS